MANKNSPTGGLGEKRIDEPTGTAFVGHEWDGIEELDTPMPRWWLWCLYLSIIWGIVYVILYPAWPMIDKATEGTLGWTSRGQLAQEMDAADLAKQSFREQLAAVDVVKLQDNPEIMQQAVAGGFAAFKVNCVQCHGSGAAGSQGLGYPNLADDDWLWGGDLQSIEYTITHGIRQQGHDETRASAMPPYAGVIEGEQLAALVDHVLSLSGKAESNAVGAALYETNCVSCHGPSGEGDRVQGAPTLADAIWLYGDNRADIARQITAPRMGMMPKWEGRLDPVTIKMLAAYVHSLGGGEDAVEVAEEPAVETDEQS